MRRPRAAFSSTIVCPPPSRREAIGAHQRQPNPLSDATGIDAGHDHERRPS